MSLKYPLLLILFWLALSLPAQEITPPPDPGSEFSRPGVTNSSVGKGLLVEYSRKVYGPLGYLAPDIEGIGAETSNDDRLRVKLKVPVINHPDFKFLLGYTYLQERFDFHYFEGNDSENPFLETHHIFKIGRLSSYFLKSINERYYVMLRGSIGAAGNFKGLMTFNDRRQRTYNASLLFGSNRDQQREFGLGVNYSNSPRRSLVLPIILYNQTFNSKWGVESIIPVVMKGRYNFSELNYIMFGTQFESREYFTDIFILDNIANNVESFNRQEIQFVVNWERQLVPWLWLAVEGGYRYNFRVRLFATDFTELPAFGPDAPRSGMFARVGIFLSPPKDLTN